jgi:hypothetical protein
VSQSHFQANQSGATARETAFYSHPTDHRQNLPSKSPQANQLLPQVQRRRANGKAVPSGTEQPWIR